MSRPKSSTGWYSRAAALGAMTVVGAIVGCGGEDRGRLVADSEMNPGSTNPCAIAAKTDLSPQVDFESAPPSGWWVGDDGSGPLLSQREKLDEPLCGHSETAFHIQASDLAIWGGNVAYTFQPPYDAQAEGWEGIALWARREPDSEGQALFIAVSDKYTMEGQGYCADSTIDTEKCDRFGSAIGLQTEWRLFLVPFANMKQRAYGVPSPGIDLPAILQLNLYFDIGDWDFWVDDWGFYKAKPQ